MNKKSLTVICHNLLCGGTEKVLTNIVYYYSNKDIETTIITLGAANIFPGLKLSKKTTIIELPKNLSNNIFLKISNIFTWIFEINKYIKENNDSIFLSFLPIPNILTAISSWNININHYGSERVNPQYINLSFHWRLLRFITYRKMNRLIVQTEVIKKKFSNYVPERKIDVIPNYVKNIITKKNIKEKGNKKLKVLFIGRLEYQKGIDIVLDMIIEISKSKNKAKYIFEIVGNGSLSELVDYSIKKNNLSSYVSFIKGSSNPNKYINKSDVVLHPSRYEGMSNVVLEAMSYGKCVISTYQSSAEIITNYKDGILIRKITAFELIKNIEKISLDRKLLKDIGTEAVKKINLYYLEKRVLKLWSKTLKI